jgi:hypothetical protein
MYAEYFPIKDAIVAYLARKLPLAISKALVFEILSTGPKVPLFFNQYGKLDIEKIQHKFTHNEIQSFLDKIHSDGNFEKYVIWEEVLKKSLV